MTRDDVQAYLTAKYHAPIVEFIWRDDPIAFNGTAIIDVSKAVKGHERILVGFWAPKECASDDELKAQLQHSIDSARQTIDGLIAEKGAAS